MLYDIGLRIAYDYETPASGARHMLRVLPLTVPGVQRLIAGSLTIRPQPSERSDFTDFFGNPASSVLIRPSHDHFELRLQARVQVEIAEPSADLTPTLDALAQDLALVRTLDASSPHHFVADSPRLPQSAVIARWARSFADKGLTVRGIAEAMCTAIHRDFAYDPKATTVDTPATRAFELKKGVCQDFAHVMILGLRSLGIPAGYVSGYLRTIPPPGQERLEGADAMHAWVRLWCGGAAGWLELDPTNNIAAGSDHIRAAFGRDYSDVAPVIGVLKSYGSHTTLQQVDVVPV